MKYYELDTAEEKILQDFESGKMKPVKKMEKMKKLYQDSARGMLQKAKNINIRLSEHDLLKLKARALEEGLPYQTYLASLVHKHLKA